MSARRRRRPAEITTNLTPLIDVTFLLIVFFVLVSRLVEVENAELDLPAPANPLTMAPGRDLQVVVNVIPGQDGSVLELRVGPLRFEADPNGWAALTRHLAEQYAANPQINVNLRADRRTHYAFVQPVMDAVVAAARRAAVPGLHPRINLVVLNDS